MGAAAAAVLLLAFLSLRPRARRAALRAAHARLRTLVYGQRRARTRRALGRARSPTWRWWRSGPLALTCAAGLAGRPRDRAEVRDACSWRRRSRSAPRSWRSASRRPRCTSPRTCSRSRCVAAGARRRSRATRPRPTTPPRPTRGACATWSWRTRSRSARRCSTWRCGSCRLPRVASLLFPLLYLYAGYLHLTQVRVADLRQLVGNTRGALDHGGRAGRRSSRRSASGSASASTCSCSTRSSPRSRCCSSSRRCATASRARWSAASSPARSRSSAGCGRCASG